MTALRSRGPTPDLGLGGRPPGRLYRTSEVRPMPKYCATCDAPLGTVYVVDYNLNHHVHCFLQDLDLDEMTVPSVAEALRRFAHDQATRAIGMVLGS